MFKVRKVASDAETLHEVVLMGLTKWAVMHKWYDFTCKDFKQN